MGASCSSFRLLSAVLIKLFHVSWNASSDSAICTRILILACSWCRILHELSNFWWHFLTEKLLTNQIAPLLSICEWTELGKMLISFLSIPSPSLLIPPNFSTFFAHPRPACSLTCSILAPGTGKERTATQATWNKNSCLRFHLINLPKKCYCLDLWNTCWFL